VPDVCGSFFVYSVWLFLCCRHAYCGGLLCMGLMGLIFRPCIVVVVAFVHDGIPNLSVTWERYGKPCGA
jgi:hypothetical protein